jgi:hypothetical protein
MMTKVTKLITTSVGIMISTRRSVYLSIRTVVPANAGTHVLRKENGAPAFAGATSWDLP